NLFNAGDDRVAITLAAGEDVACTFTTTKNVRIMITKGIQCGTGTFTFTGTPNGTISTNNGTVTATALQPGTFTSTESVPAGWVRSEVRRVGDDCSAVMIGGRCNIDAGDHSLAVNLAA